MLYLGDRKDQKCMLAVEVGTTRPGHNEGCIGNSPSFGFDHSHKSNYHHNTSQL